MLQALNSPMRFCSRASKALTPTATQIALRIPEILIKIFAYSSKSDLLSISLVCRAFTSPAYSLLYRNISLQWHFLPMQPLLRTFCDNTTLFLLVNSLEIFYNEGEATKLDPDARWLGSKAGDAILSLLNFIRCLKRLRHLTLFDIYLNEPLEIPLSLLKEQEIPVFLLKDLEEVMRGLVSMSFPQVFSTFWERLYGSATSIKKIDLCTEWIFPSFQTYPPLRHLEIYLDGGSPTKMGAFVSAFHNTLETLRLTWYLHDDDTSLVPTHGAFDKLTHFCLSPPQMSDLSPIQSFLKSMPVLRYLRWENSKYCQPLLPHFTPFLPSTIRSIDYLCWGDADSLERLLEEASLRHLRELQYDVHSYLVLSEYSAQYPSPGKVMEISSRALLEGVKVIDSSQFEQLPTLLDIWQDDQC